MATPTGPAPIDPGDPVGRPDAGPPRTPAWYPAAVGLVAALLVGALVYDRGRPAVLVAGVLVAVACAALLGRYRHGRVVPSSLAGAPPELRQALRTHYLVLGIAACVVVAAARSLPHLVATGLCFVAVTVGVSRYERLHRRATQAAREA